MCSLLILKFIHKVTGSSSRNCCLGCRPCSPKLLSEISCNPHTFLHAISRKCILMQNSSVPLILTIGLFQVILPKSPKLFLFFLTCASCPCDLTSMSSFCYSGELLRSSPFYVKLLFTVSIDYKYS
jgi:hypothetical protein